MHATPCALLAVSLPADQPHLQVDSGYAQLRLCSGEELGPIRTILYASGLRLLPLPARSTIVPCRVPLCVSLLSPSQRDTYDSATSLDAAGLDMLYLGLAIVWHMVLTVLVDAVRNSPHLHTRLFSGIAGPVG
jgi:hypothetical protein